MSYADDGLHLDRHKWIASALVAATTGCELIAGIHDLRFSEAGDEPDAQTPPEDSAGDDTGALSEGGDESSESGDSSANDASDAPAGEASKADAGSRDSGDSSSTEAGDGATSDSGALDATRDGPACVGDLSNIGTSDFHISLTVTTTQSARTALINQRASCMAALCTPGAFWDIRVLNGALYIETSDSVPNCSQVTTAGAPGADASNQTLKVNDGKPHRVIVQRVAQTITAYIDGVATGSGPSKSSFGQLPPVSSTDPCEATGNTAPFLGSITNLCVTSP